MRRAVVLSFLVLSMSGCANDTSTEGLPQGLTVLEAEVGSLSLAYRSADVVIFMEAARGNETPEPYRSHPDWPAYEMDARFSGQDGFVFYLQQGGHEWVQPQWEDAINAQLAAPTGEVRTNEEHFRLATEASRTMREDIAEQLGDELAAQLAPEINTLVDYASVAHEQFLVQRDHFLQQRMQELGEVPTLDADTGELAYGSTGPEDPYWYYGLATNYAMSLHADSLDGIPGYAGGYHSATARHYYNNGAYTNHSSCNHGRCATSMTQRGATTSYKSFGASQLVCYHCSGEYKWDSDGGSYGHNCHDDSRIQMHNYAYVSTVWGTFRWCDGGDRDHDISVDILFVELDQEGYPQNSNSTNRGYGAP